MTTYEDIQDAVLDQVGKSDTATRDRAKRNINLGQRDFILRELWPFREATEDITTAVGTQEYDITNLTDIDTGNIISVAIQGASAKKLPYVPYNQLRASNPDFDLAGSSVPTCYYIKGGQIGFWPVPNDTYTITVDYYLTATDMSANADESIIPVGYLEALMQYALSMEHDYNSDPDLAQKAMNRYEEIVILARQNLLSQPIDTGNFRILGPADFRNHTDIRT